MLVILYVWGTDLYVNHLYVIQELFELDNWIGLNNELFNKFVNLINSLSKKIHIKRMIHSQKDFAASHKISNVSRQIYEWADF